MGASSCCVIQYSSRDCSEWCAGLRWWVQITCSYCSDVHWHHVMLTLCQCSLPTQLSIYSMTHIAGGLVRGADVPMTLTQSAGITWADLLRNSRSSVAQRRTMTVAVRWRSIPGCRQDSDLNRYPFTYLSSSTGVMQLRNPYLYKNALLCVTRVCWMSTWGTRQ